MREKIKQYVLAGYSGLYVVSFEEKRIEADLAAVAGETKFGLYAWSLTEGIVDCATGSNLGANEPADMLAAFQKLPEKSILLARDFHQFLSASEVNPLICRLLKDCLSLGKVSNRVFVCCGCALCLPAELEKEMAVIEHKLPDREELRAVLSGIANSAGKPLNGGSEALIDAASGLTSTEAENAAALSVVVAGDLVASIIQAEKASTVKKNGILEIVSLLVTLNQIGGLDLVKAWVTKRRAAFSAQARAYGLPIPKGALFVGVPGCGKSLLAKAAAVALGCPLLKLDAGKLFGSLVGQSEGNLRAVIQTAEAIAPCVLWIDELEKGFSGSKSSGQTDGGTSARVFGSFLQWLQEKTSAVFVVATANDVSALPPELMRKGRFDEIWFVDLPNPEERAEIWKIQIGKFGRKVDAFDVPGLVAATEGFTGAEIECLFSEALFTAFDAGSEPDDALLLSLARAVVPLSKMMSAEVDALRRWADGRARRATSPLVSSGVAKQRKLG